jgi:GntR family transcriptional regulator/MocR family aminotransferase
MTIRLRGLGCRAKIRQNEQAMSHLRVPSSVSFVPLQRETDVPLFLQIHRRIRGAILGGELRPGAKLPSTRVLAAQLPASRATVQAAYDMLAAEGYVAGQGARGTVVAPLTAVPPPPAVPVAAPVLDQPALPHIPAPPAKLFQMGLPSIDSFPRKLWSRLAVRAARRLSAAELVQQLPAGHAPLRQAIAGYLGLARGVACTADQVLITAGFQGALALIAAVLLRSGDQVWIEDPGYFMARNALELLGAEIVPVPVDQEGLDVAVGVAAAPEARLAIVTPTHQFPLGMALSLRRRFALLDWARATGGWIVEDDYDSEFRYLGRPLPALHGLDPDGRVLYVGTFSKVLFPSLRLGYLVVPRGEVDRFARAHALLNGNASMLEQTIVAAFMDEGHFTRHISRMRRLYAERRKALAEALAGALGRTAPVERAAGGMHLLVRLPAGLRDVDALAGAYRQGLGGRALSTLAMRADPGQALLLSFTNIPAELAPREASRMRQALIG